MFHKYVAAPRKGLQKKENVLVVAGSLESFLGRKVESTIECEIKSSGVRRFCSGTIKMTLKEPRYQRVLRRDEMLYCSVLKELYLTAKEVLWWRVASMKVTRYDAAEQAAVAALENIVVHYKRLANKCQTREKAGSIGSSGSESGPKLGGRARVRKPRSEYGKEE